MRIKKVTLFVILCFLFLIAKSQTADEVINKYVVFIGGEQNWKKVKTITTTGIYNYGGMEFPFVAYSKAPALYKYIVTANGKSFTQAYDGKVAWRIDGFKNETTKTILKDKEATAMANEADVELESPFINYWQKGHRVLLQGNDTVNNQVCYKIKLIRKDGDTASYFFNSGNFALIKKQAFSKNAEMNKAPLDILYSDYQETDGIKTPHKIACTAEGQKILTVIVESIQLNLPMEDNMFKP